MALIGESAGAGVAIRCTLSTPDMVRGVVLAGEPAAKPVTSNGRGLWATLSRILQVESSDKRHSLSKKNMERTI